MSRTRTTLLIVAGAASLGLAAQWRSAVQRPSPAEREPRTRELTTPPQAASPTSFASFAAIPVDDPAELRALVERCRSADQSETPELEALALAARDPLVAANALRALGRLGRVTTASSTARLVHDPRPRVRQEAVLALGLGGDPAAVDVLSPLLADEALRPLAIRSLGELGDERARERLEELLNATESSESDRAFARSALARRRSQG